MRERYVAVLSAQVSTTTRFPAEALGAICPSSGKFLEIVCSCLILDRMPDREVVERVAASTGLTIGEAERVIDDVLAWYREPVEDFVRRRHADLHLHGVRNDLAFRTIRNELAQRLVAPPELTERQVRRIIYG